MCSVGECHIPNVHVPRTTGEPVTTCRESQPESRHLSPTLSTAAKGNKQEAGSTSCGQRHIVQAVTHRAGRNILRRREHRGMASCSTGGAEAGSRADELMIGPGVGAKGKAKTAGRLTAGRRYKEMTARVQGDASS